MIFHRLFLLFLQFQQSIVVVFYQTTWRCGVHVGEVVVGSECISDVVVTSRVATNHVAISTTNRVNITLLVGRSLCIVCMFRSNDWHLFGANWLITAIMMWIQIVIVCSGGIRCSGDAGMRQLCMCVASMDPMHPFKPSLEYLHSTVLVHILVRIWR